MNGHLEDIMTMKFIDLFYVAIASLIIFTSSAVVADFIDVKVQANDTKSDGLPWDGCPSTFWDPPIPGKGLFGNIMYNPAEPNPPEIRLMILKENGKIESHTTNDCNDTLECEFSKIPYKKEVLGFILFDADMGSHDLIEAVVLVPSKSPQWKGRAKKVRQMLKAELPRFAMAEMNFCRGPRSPKKLTIEPIALDECTHGIGCTLKNSYWSVGNSDGKIDDWKW